jgi:UMF1 family MFS transporter
MFGLILASAMVGFSEVFNNSVLATIETPENSGWLSGMGYGLGYISGLIALILFLVIFVWPGGETENLFGLNTSEYEHIRIVGPLCAIWYALFIIPLFLFTPDLKKKPITTFDSIKVGLTNFINTVKEAKRYKNIFISLSFFNFIYHWYGITLVFTSRSSRRHLDCYVWFNFSLSYGWFL